MAQQCLQEAREKWKDAQAQLRTGSVPTTERRIEKLRAIPSAGKTFEQVALEWRETKYPVDSKTGDDALHRTRMNIFPDFGALPIDSISPPPRNADAGEPNVR